MRYWRRYILAGVCAAFLAAFLVVPILMAIGSGLFDPRHYPGYWIRWVFEDLAAREGLLNALKVACLTTAGVLLLAVPLAVLTNQFNFRGKGLATALVLGPMILPPFVGALAMSKLLAQYSGPVNLMLQSLGLPAVDWLGSGLPGVVVLEILHLYPIMYLNASAALANVDPTMLEAGRSLGASRWTVFRRITLPLTSPGLFAGGTIVFIWSFTELGTPLMLGYENVLPVQVFRALQEADISPKVFAMVFVMLTASVVLYALGRRLFGRAAAATAGRGVAATVRRAGPAATAGIWLAFGLVTLIALLPHVGVVLMAFAHRWNATILPEVYTLGHFAEVFHRGQTWNSIANSLQYASVATVIDLAVGLVIAYLVVRLKVRGRSVLDGLAMLPLAVPGIVLAGGYVAMTTPGVAPGGLGRWLEQFGPRCDPTLILIVAYSIRRLPYVVRSIAAGLEQTSPTLEEAARNLGASPARAVVSITLPLISANVVAGAILAFSFAMLEVSDSLILAQTRDFYPITKEIYELVSLADSANVAAALGTLGMLLLAGTLLAANRLLGKRLGAMFRV